ncbi:hypothetical protein K0B96_06885 [Horticoccus luteus]|uniref:Tetratricopeptide repeat protein n=1 Tax=Horticoccus luteus TaxID=2862869 RepID=A0A8F9XHK1_9BACT|nr:CDC27 family protein [Horticoccus luteus]QYM80332.1 hypothetical protein K0B96_06885 [Horticoccus luteus]
MNKRSSPLRRWLIAGVILALVLGAGYYFGRYHALPAYREWRAAKLQKLANDYFAKGDYDSALLTARQILRTDKRNDAMWRLAEKSANAKQLPETVYYQRELAKLDKTLDSQLEYIRLALHYDLLREALDGVNKVGAAGRDSADFHDLAAQVYLRIGKPTSARVHLYSLVQLRPDDGAAQLELDSVEMNADDERQDKALRERVQKLAQQPALRARAYTLLLKDALRAKNAAEAEDYAQKLIASEGTDAQQQVLALEGLRLKDGAKAAAYRAKLETAFANSPDDAAVLTEYYSRAGEGKEALRWAKTLPDKTKAAPEFQRALADAYISLRDWSGLNTLVSTAQWGDREYLRYAYLSYAARGAGRIADATTSWKMAVIRAGDSARETSDLLSRIIDWGWDQEKYDLIWKLFELMPRNEAIARQLIVWERTQGHTANLNRIFARLFELDPEDRVARNNFAYTSLLLDSNLAQAYALSRENYLSEPHNPYYVTTQALALQKQGKSADALALIESLRPAELSEPERMLCRALIHAANGDALGAQNLLTGTDLRNMLPEEKGLVKDTRNRIAKIEQEQGRASQLYAIQESGSVNHAEGWLPAVTELSRDNAPKDLLLADSLFAARDWKGLTELLNTTDWGRNDSIRLALLAYLARQNKDEGTARTQWRRALTLAGRDVSKLHPLAELATAWNWRVERLEAWDRLFERMPDDTGILKELLAYHRAAGRTGDMVRILDGYFAGHPEGGPEMAHFAYYSMLSGINVTRAYLNAKKAYEASPENLDARVVYAFSLYQQKRSDEAWKLVENVPATGDSVVPVALVRAAVLTDLNRPSEARQALANFKPEHALPEEVTLAGSLRRKLADAGGAAGK